MTRVAPAGDPSRTADGNTEKVCTKDRHRLMASPCARSGRMMCQKRARALASTLGAKAQARFWHIILPLLAQGLAINLCLSFVQTFSVFPSAVLLGSPASATRVISIAAYQAAYEQYDYSMASAVAMIMGFVQLAVVALILSARALFYRGAVGGGKG